MPPGECRGGGWQASNHFRAGPGGQHQAQAFFAEVRRSVFSARTEADLLIGNARSRRTEATKQRWSSLAPSCIESGPHRRYYSAALSTKAGEVWKGLEDGFHNVSSGPPVLDDRQRALSCLYPRQATAQYPRQMEGFLGLRESVHWYKSTREVFGRRTGCFLRTASLPRPQVCESSRGDPVLQDSGFAETEDKCLDEGEMDILEMVSGDGKAERQRPSEREREGEQRERGEKSGPYSDSH